MDRSTLLHLIEKFRRGQCTAAEEQLLHRWLDLLEQDAGSYFPLSAEEKRRIRSNMLKHIFPLSEPAPRRVFFRTWMKVAAVLLPLVAAGAYYLWQPAGNRHNGWLTQQNQTAQVQQFKLPDSSLVILGAHTTIRFPAKYTGPERIVKLLGGKAFFNVRSLPQQPFIVESNGIRTTVLGTSFSVASYKELYACRVTVMTGRVKVHTGSNNYSVLNPAERITIPGGKTPVLRDTISLADNMAWTRGEIVLRNASLQELIQMLREQYAVNTSTSLDISEGSYTLRLPANMPLRGVLDVIEKISYKPKIHFTMENNQLSIHQRQ
ncbi:FecR family protein [uncultured Chitinophaga sp.]|uniref:FecR family protein n=1 Tax=uncultured Chitinophaga sp. TaxID=339340 RepID=UPI002623C74C|nr:FecR family protein [uncultured Chitinophaga sp.]